MKNWKRNMKQFRKAEKENRRKKIENKKQEKRKRKRPACGRAFAIYREKMPFVRRSL